MYYITIHPIVVKIFRLVYIVLMKAVDRQTVTAIPRASSLPLLKIETEMSQTMYNQPAYGTDHR